MNQRSVILGGAVGLFLLLCWVPPLLLLGSAFRGNEGLTWSVIEQVLLTVRQLELLGNSLVVGVGTAVLATLIGAPVGFLVSRTDLPLRRLFTFLCLAPIIVPPYVMGIAFTELFFELERSLGPGAAAWVPRITGLSGAIFLLSVSLYPIPMLLAMKGFRSIDGDSEDAALMLGGPVRCFFSVTLRMARPAILAGALFVFVFAFSDFSIPDFLSFTNPSDAIPHVFATEVFSQFQRFRSSPTAGAASLPLVVIVMLTALLMLRLEGRGDFVVRGGSAVPPRTRKLGTYRLPAALGVTLVAAITTVLPFVKLCRWTFSPSQGGTFAALDEALGTTGADIGRSLLLAAGAGLGLATIGFGVAYAITRSRSHRASRVLAALALLPLAFPAVTLAIGQIRFWNHPWNPLADLVYPSVLLVGLTYVARFLPIAVLTLRSSLRAVDPTLEDAATLAGHGFASTLLRIVAPIAARGLLTAAVVGFLLSMRELDCVVLLPAGSDTLPHRVYSMVHTSRDAIIGALCLILVISTAIPLLVYRFVFGRRLEII